MERKPLNRKRLVAIIVVGVLAIAATWMTSRGGGSFDLSNRNIPLDQIVSGGPPKDGIPALLEPRFIPAAEASFLGDRDRILGLSRGKKAKAYPVRILNWHEVVNDFIGGDQMVVTYCPLCGTGIAFDAQVEGQVHTFGVSGLLYQSDLLMYDHQTESLWSQVSMKAVAGPLTGSKLTPLYLEHTTWHEWKQQHPETLVLSAKTGYLRDYGRDPYDGYENRRDLMFDVTHFDPTYHPKAWVVGVEVNGLFKAYAFSELERVAAARPLTDKVNGRTIHVHFNQDARSASITDAKGGPLPSVMAFWFAWYAFHPDTRIYLAPK